MAVHCSLGCTEYTYIGMLGPGGVLCWWQEMYCCLPSRTILPNGAYMFFMLPRCVYFLSGRIMHWPLEQQMLRGHGRVCTMEFDTKVGSENKINSKHKTRKLSSPRPCRVPKGVLQCSQKQPRSYPNFRGFTRYGHASASPSYPLRSHVRKHVLTEWSVHYPPWV